MIVVELAGGLGNQMFQYAAARSLALARETTLALDTSFYSTVEDRRFSLDAFALEASIATPALVSSLLRPRQLLRRAANHTRLLPARLRSVYREAGFGFDPTFFRLSDGVYLAGYWQSERYFAWARKTILADFRFRHALSGDSLRLAEQASGEESVSIHVRRGDYVSDPATNLYHGTCGPEYYYRALDEVSKRARPERLYVFSDDIAWAEENLRFAPPTVFVASGDPRGISDMQLMSLCRHNIIANSTFSWWAAYLNANPRKIVCSPGEWFSGAAHDTSSLLPEEWIRV